MLTRILDSYEGPFQFSTRNVPVPGDLRPTWRVSVTLLIIAHAGYRGTVSLNKMHLISWAARSKELRESFLQTLEGTIPKSQFPVRFDPAQNRAIHFAHGEGLVEIIKKTQGLQIKITERGKDFVGLIERDPTLLSAEKSFLMSIGQRVTEVFVKDLMRWRDRP